MLGFNAFQTFNESYENSRQHSMMWVLCHTTHATARFKNLLKFFVIPMI